MTDDGALQVIDYELATCPKCGKAHRYKLKVRVQEAVQKVPVFGGVAAGGGKSELLLTCPDTKAKFTYDVPNPVGGDILGLASEADLRLAAASPTAAPGSESGFADWVSKSRDSALDFCKLMLSSATGAIPLYFAVLKYIGFEKIGASALSRFAIVPPALFLLAAVLFVLALRPQYDVIAPSDFSSFRARRLGRLNQFIIWGTGVFVTATAVAVVIFFYALGS